MTDRLNSIHIEHSLDEDCHPEATSFRGEGTSFDMRDYRPTKSSQDRLEMLANSGEYDLHVFFFNTRISVAIERRD